MPVQSIVTAQESFEGAGFPVHRPFPQPGAELTATDPFLMLDEMGPIHYGPGEAVGAPDHPHRGFETVTYLFDGGDGTPRLDRRRWGAARRRHAMDDRGRRARAFRDADRGDDARRRSDARHPAVGQPAACRQAHCSAIPRPHRRQAHAGAHRRRPRARAPGCRFSSAATTAPATRTRRSSTPTQRSMPARTFPSRGRTCSTRSSTC